MDEGPHTVSASSCSGLKGAAESTTARAASRGRLSPACPMALIKAMVFSLVAARDAAEVEARLSTFSPSPPSQRCCRLCGRSNHPRNRARVGDHGRARSRDRTLLETRHAVKKSAVNVFGAPRQPAVSKALVPAVRRGDHPVSTGDLRSRQPAHAARNPCSEPRCRRRSRRRWRASRVSRSSAA